MNGLAAGAIDEQSLSKSALMVRLSHVAKTYPRGVISTVRDLGPDIKHGQVLTLLRPSACDKTTTLRTIAGLEAVNEGALYFKDRPLVQTSPATRQQDTLAGLWGHVEAQQLVSERTEHCIRMEEQFPCLDYGDPKRHLRGRCASLGLDGPEVSKERVPQYSEPTRSN